MPNTVEQQRAIDTIVRNVSVSAGAGSGKTSVLQQRFLNILKESKKNIEAKKGKFPQNHVFSASTYEGVKSGNIVGITFTRKAAGEIKSRIRSAVLQAMQEGDASFWRMQLAELERAEISTIDSLCSHILRENPVEANLDPNFVTVEDFDYEVFKEETILKFIRVKLADAGENSVKALCDVLGAGALRKYLHELAPSLEDIAQEKDLAAAYEASIAALPTCIEKLKTQLQFMASERDNLALTATGKKAKSHQNLEALGSNLPEIFADLDALSLSSVKNALIFNAQGRVKEERDRANNIIDEIETALIDRESLPLLSHWENILKELNEFIAGTKLNENILTYDDLETRAIELLTSNEEIRHKYQNRYQYLMVDEFQDTNDKQCALIYLLCGDSKENLLGNKLFIVGDPKQSIYRFRGAEVDVFTRVQREIKASGGINISMKTNFRSKDSILDCCNEAFDKIMGETSSSVEFEALDCAEFNKDFPVSPELIKINPASANPKYLELAAIAQRILAAAEKERARENFNPNEKIYGNMAVLLRAMTKVNELAEVLTAYNIPFVVIDGKGFYERQEVADIINLFDLLLDHYQNIPLAAILRSPYFAFDDELLTKVFLKDEYGWDALLNLGEDVSGFTAEQRAQIIFAVKKLKYLKDCMAYMDLPENWSELWRTLDVEAVISMQKNGKQKLANLKKLRKLSLEYIQEKNVGTAEWLEFVKDARSMGMRETNANLDAVDAVQIMTIHKSKGLEFDKVFLPFLGSRINSDTRSIVYAKGLGLGIQMPDAAGNLVKTSVFKAIKDAEKNKDREERQRLLYVAMTRAKNELYMFGVPETSKKEFEEAKWFEQLWTVCEEFDGVICKEFSDEDLLDVAAKEEVPTIKIDAELEKAILPLPEFTQSGRILFTASSLAEYLYCERQYFYADFMKLPAIKEEVESADNLPAASVIGDIIHETLEKYHEGMELRKLFSEIAKVHAEGKNTENAWEILKSYVESPLYKNIPSKQLHEYGFTVEVEENLQFTGFVDVIAFNEDGSLTIIDYKSGKPPADGEEKLAYMHQLAIYKYALEKIFDKKVTSAQLHFLQNSSKVELRDENLFEQVIALAKEIASKTKEEEFSCNLDACAHCSFNYLCRKK